MIFNSIEFLLFFILVLLFYYTVPCKYQKIWLLICSYFFYMSWNVGYATLILGLTLCTFVTGLVIEKHNRIGRKGFFVGSIVFCISVLCAFKYGGFIIENVNAFLQVSQIDKMLPEYSFVLPMGISFYTFMSLGYIVDVYRGKVPAEKNIINYALFLSFFPTVVSGPIERSDNLLVQIRTQQKFDWERIKCGLMWMLYGYFMKIVIADRAAIVVNNVYDNFPQYSGSICLIASLLFTFQIYCDFCGYTNIARGAALVLGFDLVDNFRQPYLACSIKDFWSRWHLSLSRWFRDYLYIPLGGSRKGKCRTYINKMITFLISGLWHGAAWHYVIWGGLHGLYQIAEDVLTNGNRKEAIGWRRIPAVIVTFCLVSLAWVFFRANTLSDAVGILGNIFGSFNYMSLLDGTLWNLGWGRMQIVGLFGGCILIMFVDVIMEYRNVLGFKVMFRTPFIKTALSYIMIIYILIVTVQSYGQNASSFIYAQF